MNKNILFSAIWVENDCLKHELVCYCTTIRLISAVVFGEAWGEKHGNDPLYLLAHGL